MTRSDEALHGATSAPWWRYPMVWMLISGPAVVVVAGFATLWLAIRMPDPVVDEDYYRKGLELSEHRTLMPAERGRNHAATPNSALQPAEGR